jgi:hypothetical protein
MWLLLIALDGEMLGDWDNYGLMNSLVFSSSTCSSMFLRICFLIYRQNSYMINVPT